MFRAFFFKIDKTNNLTSSVPYAVYAWSPPRPRQLTAIISKPLIANGTELGKVVVYDDLSTVRPEDYLEIYSLGGDLMAIVWFDRFGIQRVAVDRALANGKDQVEGILIAVVNGDYV